MSTTLKSIKHDDEFYVSINDLLTFFMDHSPNKDIMMSKNNIIETFTKYKISLESRKEKENVEPESTEHGSGI